MGEFSLGFSLITKYLSDRLNRRFFRAIFWKGIWNSLIIFFLKELGLEMNLGFINGRFSMKEFLKGISNQIFFVCNSNLPFDKLACQSEKIIQEGKNEPWNVNCQYQKYRQNFSFFSTLDNF